MLLVHVMSAVSGPGPSISCNTKELKNPMDECLYIVDEHMTLYFIRDCQTLTVNLIVKTLHGINCSNQSTKDCYATECRET